MFHKEDKLIPWKIFKAFNSSLKNESFDTY